MSKDYFIAVEKNVKIYCKVVGSGEPILLLHGHNQSGRSFKKWITFLAKQYQVIIMDSRYHGKSTKVGNITIKQLATDVHQVLTYFNIKKSYFIGYSDGANILLQLAVDYPEEIKKMVLISPNASFDGLQRRYQRLFLLWKKILQLLNKFSKITKHQYKKVSLLTDDPNIKKEELNTISIPTLLIYSHTDIIKTKHIEYLKKNIKTSKLILIKNSSHLSMLRKFPRYKEEIIQFLTEEGIQQKK